MSTTRRTALHWLQATVLLAIGATTAAACKTVVTLDCSATTQEGNGLVACGPAQTRPEPVTCGAPIVGSTSCGDLDICTTDADCVDGAIGRCVASGVGALCECAYGCASDADCGASEVCFCGDTGGRCVPADCKTNDDCEDGQACIMITQNNDPCGGSSATPAFACSTGNDECLADSHCADGQNCGQSSEGPLRCMTFTCYEGRPFFIGGELRTALASRSSDWARILCPDTGHLSPKERQALAERWTRVGQLEHASVASFARFALQLMSLGAPADLVEATTASMADESLHARLAFGLASAFRGEPVGPGRLNIDGALGKNDLATIVTTLIHEGCVGETVAAALAQEELARTGDPCVAAVLAQIARDEERHAALAFRSLAWILESGIRGQDAESILVSTVRALEMELLVSKRAPRPSDEEEAPAGTLSPSEMASLRSQVLTAVVLPSLHILLARRDAGQAFVEPRFDGDLLANGAV